MMKSGWNCSGVGTDKKCVLKPEARTALQEYLIFREAFQNVSAKRCKQSNGRIPGHSAERSCVELANGIYPLEINGMILKSKTYGYQGFEDNLRKTMIFLKYEGDTNSNPKSTTLSIIPQTGYSAKQHAEKYGYKEVTTEAGGKKHSYYYGDAMNNKYASKLELCFNANGYVMGEPAYACYVDMSEKKEFDAKLAEDLFYNICYTPYYN